MSDNGLKLFPFLASIIIGTCIWFYPTPEGLNPEAWHLLAVFISTIIALVTTPLPMGACSLIALTLLAATDTLTFQQAFAGFGHQVVWLVVIAFFIAHGFIITGLGRRIAYLFVYMLGKHTLGLGYGMLLSDLALAPGIPSAAARSGGFMFPIVKSIADSYESFPKTPSARKVGAFLILTSFQGSAVTSAMFLTAMAANPLIAEIAADFNIEITWGTWALAACVPGMISLALLPLVIYWIYPPTVRQTPKAKQWAKDQLHGMGPMTLQEKIMLGTFSLLIVLWIFGKTLGVSSTIAALMGCSILLITGVLNWKALLKLTNVWETFIWFSTLVTMASQLNHLGFTPYLSKVIVSSIYGLPAITAFAILILFYFYSHYFFASSTAHVGAMYATFLAIAIGLGIDPLLSALTLAFMSNLFAGLTHYSFSPAPLLFGAGYVPIKVWWGVGFLVSVLYLLIWGTVGLAWWRFIGIF